MLTLKQNHSLIRVHDDGLAGVLFSIDLFFVVSTLLNINVNDEKLAVNIKRYARTRTHTHTRTRTHTLNNSCTQPAHKYRS